MSRSYRSRLTRSALALTLLAVTIGALATSASAATKTFSLNIITPSSAGAGTTSGYSATITNESGGTLDSVTLIPPAGFTLLPPGGTFNGLGLGNGSSTTVNFSARTPCAANGSYSWSATGTGANNQHFTLNTATSSRATTLTGKCSLAFSHVGSGEQGAFLSTVDYKAYPGAAAVTVTLLDANGGVTKSADGANVQLALSPNLAGALPASAASSALSDGVATFSSLKVTQSNLAYILAASLNANVTDGTSNTFKIWDKDIKCQAATPCGQSYKAGDLTTEPNATFESNDGLLISYGVSPALCDSPAYNSATHLPTVVTVDSEGGQFTSNWTIKFSVSKQYDQVQAQNGASFYEICLASTAPFITLEGEDAAQVDLGGVTYYVGLVQNGQQCVDPAPCILSKTKTRTGVVIIVLRLEAGDPWTH